MSLLQASVKQKNKTRSPSQKSDRQKLLQTTFSTQTPTMTLMRNSKAKTFSVYPDREGGWGDGWCSIIRIFGVSKRPVFKLSSTCSDNRGCTVLEFSVANNLNVETVEIVHFPKYLYGHMTITNCIFSTECSYGHVTLTRMNSPSEKFYTHQANTLD